MVDDQGEIKVKADTLLREVRDAVALAQLPRAWSCLYAQYDRQAQEQGRESAALPHAIWRAILEDVRRRVQLENPAYGFYLEERFWHGKTHEELRDKEEEALRPGRTKPWRATNTVKKHERAAVDLFIHFFIQQEQTCRERAASEVPLPMKPRLHRLGNMPCQRLVCRLLYMHTLARDDSQPFPGC